jgi:hypothetical protein
MGLAVVAWLAVPWPAGCRDRERLPAEPGAAAGRWRSRRPSLPDLPGRRLAAMIAIGRPRQRLSSFTDRGAWLHGVARGRVVGGALAGRLPGSRASASGTWRRYRQVAIETPAVCEAPGRSDRCLGRPAAGDDRRGTADEFEAPGFTGLPVVACLAVPWPAGCRDRERRPAEPGAAAGRERSRRRVCPICAAGSGDDRHRAPPGTAVEFHRSRRLASRGCPWSRGWQCLGRPAAGIASDCQRNLAPLPAGAIETPEFARSARPAAGDDRHRAPPGTAVEFHRSRRLASWGCPWSRGWRCLGRPAAGIASDVPAEPGAAAGRERSRRRVCPSCPAGSGDDRHRAPPGTAVEFHRSRRLASWGCPWSRVPSVPLGGADLAWPAARCSEHSISRLYGR